MSRYGGHSDGDWIAGLVGLSIFVLFVLAFWWLKGFATVLKAFAAEPGHPWLWLSTIAALILTLLAIATQGNGAAIGLAITSYAIPYLIARSIVGTSVRRSGGPRSLDDVIKLRW